MKANKSTVLRVAVLLLASIDATAAVNSNAGGLGCGTIVSMRESTQQPLPSELADNYGGARRTSGGVAQILGAIPGVGAVAAVVADMVADEVISSVSAKMKAEDKANQVQTATFRDVQAVEFQFDDGEVINVPLYVVDGMGYKKGVRLNAMVSPKYQNIALGVKTLFGSMPKVGDQDYNDSCRIDDPVARKKILASSANLVDESRVVKEAERRQTITTTPTAKIQNEL